MGKESKDNPKAICKKIENLRENIEGDKGSLKEFEVRIDKKYRKIEELKRQLLELGFTGYV